MFVLEQYFLKGYLELSQILLLFGAVHLFFSPLDFQITKYTHFWLQNFDVLAENEKFNVMNSSSKEIVLTHLPIILSLISFAPSLGIWFLCIFYVS